MKIIPKKIINVQKSSYASSPNFVKMEPSCDVSELGINISSRAEFPINVLSNFAPTNFELDGVPVYSMEGFLQSLKTSDRELQARICSLDGLKAKGMGKKLNKIRNYDFKHLFWNGKRYNRESKEYRELLNRAYKARYDADDDFRFALEYTENRILKHSLGGKDPKRTLLTEDEYTEILTKLRDNKGLI